MRGGSHRLRGAGLSAARLDEVVNVGGAERSSGGPGWLPPGHTLRTSNFPAYSIDGPHRAQEEQAQTVLVSPLLGRLGVAGCREEEAHLALCDSYGEQTLDGWAADLPKLMLNLGDRARAMNVDTPVRAAAGHLRPMTAVGTHPLGRSKLRLLPRDSAEVAAVVGSAPVAPERGSASLVLDFEKE